MILHLHGFASTGQGAKWEILRDAFSGHDVQSPTLPVDPLAAMTFIENLLRGNEEPHLVAGTSLGGFYAYHAAARCLVPAMIVNPSMEPWRGLAASVGTVERFDSGGETFEWTPEHVENLRVLARQSPRAPGALIHFHLARDDERLDHSTIPHEYPEAATIRWFEHAGHRFVPFDELVPEIREILALRKRLRHD